MDWVDLQKITNEAVAAEVKAAFIAGAQAFDSTPRPAEGEDIGTAIMAQRMRISMAADTYVWEREDR